MDKKEKLYERALATCVVMLIVCVILKLFGVQWFNLDTGIPLLNAIDRVVMESNLLSFVITYVFRVANMMLVLSLMSLQIKVGKAEFVWISIVAIISMVLNKFEHDTMLFDFVTMYYIFKVFHNVKFKEYLVVFFTNIVYQFISVMIRGLGARPQNYGFLNYFLLNLDYYIFLIITYLYLKKGGRTLCGAMVHFGSSLASQLWKKHSQNSKQCFDKEI